MAGVNTQQTAVVTVTGIDHVGIVAAIANALAKLNVNIVNISQTLMDGYFTMMLECHFDPTEMTIEKLQAGLDEAAKAEKLLVRAQSEAIFRAMHEL